MFIMRCTEIVYVNNLCIIIYNALNIILSSYVFDNDPLNILMM